MPAPERWYTLEELAAMLGVPVERLRARQFTLPCAVDDKLRLVVHRGDLPVWREAFVERRQAVRG